MELGIGKTREIMDRAEIQEILHSALIHEWPFSYLSMVRNHLNSHSTKLYGVDPEAGSLTVSGDILDALQDSSFDTMFFRARSGGISVVFKSSLIMPEGTTTFIKKPKFCEFEFPESLQYSQQRKAIRINLKDRQDIPVTLFVNLGVRYQGKVVDISETGTKIVFEGDLASQLEGSEIITDCQMLMPDESYIENRVRVLGVTYDEQSKMSYLRCEYVETNMNSEAQIKKLISDAIDDLSLQEVALAV